MFVYAFGKSDVNNSRFLQSYIFRATHIKWKLFYYMLTYCSSHSHINIDCSSNVALTQFFFHVYSFTRYLQHALEKFFF